MQRLFLLFITTFLLIGTTDAVTFDDYTVVIDAGHGGRDPGAIRGTIKEKNINLAVATELGRLIEKNMPGVNVVYTRKSDVFVALEKRAQIANKAKANIFISIHTNSTAAKTTRASGVDTYILGLAKSAENLAVAKRENSVIKYEEDYSTKYEGFDPDSPESYIIFEFMTNQYLQQSLDVASYIQKDFKDVAKRVDRGVRQAGFLVLRESSMPSILIELGFINNPTEVKYLNSAQGQRTMASAIYSGFKKYKNDLDKKKGGFAVQNSPTKNSSVSSQDKYTDNDDDYSSNSGEIQESQSIAGKGETEYRVQFLYSPSKLPDNSPKFKGLKPTGYTRSNGYKYTFGATTDYDEILKIQAKVRKTFKDAFVIRIKGDVANNNSNVEIKSNTVHQVNESVVTTKNSQNTKIKSSTGKIEYCVQFLYSPTKLQNNSPQFKGLQNIDYYEDGGYKYIYGTTTNYNDVLKSLRQVQKLFKDAFVIRMKDGKRIK